MNVHKSTVAINFIFGLLAWNRVEPSIKHFCCVADWFGLRFKLGLETLELMGEGAGGGGDRFE